MTVFDLKWTAERAESFKDAVANGLACDGNAAAFVPLDEHAGVKMFPTAAWRDYAMDKQTRAHANRLGPAVGESFELPTEDCVGKGMEWTHRGERKSRRFGYVTQRADTSVLPTEEEMLSVEKCLRAVPSLEVPAEFEENPKNFGRLGDKWVYIDFDEGTWN